jgi:hypothetical protein
VIQPEICMPKQGQIPLNMAKSLQAITKSSGSPSQIREFFVPVLMPPFKNPSKFSGNQDNV